MKFNLGKKKNKKLDVHINKDNSSYRILVVDTEDRIIDSLGMYLKQTGYTYSSLKDPLDAIRKIRDEEFDLLVLGYTSEPIDTEKIVEKIRSFNKEIYILLLAESSEIAPPIATIKRLDIQGYCEKNDKFDRLLLSIEAGLKSVEQMRTIKAIDSELSESREIIEQAYLEAIETLRYTVEAKDFYTRGHSDRVAAYSVLIGEKLGLSEEELKTLETGGLVHDIGKIGIPDSILLKETSLTNEEYAEIKNHPLIGAHILSYASIFTNLIPIVKYHHERYDGKGYPSGISGEDIPLLARIVSIADTFDAMISRRSYRNALSLDFAIKELKKAMGTQLDPNIVPIFIDIIENEYEKIEDIQKRY